MVDGLAAAFRALLLPSTCPFCADAIGARLLCAGCEAALPWNRCACPICALPLATPLMAACPACTAQPPPFDRAWSAFRYEAPIEQAVHGLKYHAQFRQARLLGALMADALARRPEPLPQLLLPMPLHAGRLRRRGYNQALELARALAARLVIDIDHRSARRVRATEDQIGKTAVERRRNVKGAFAVDARVRGLHVALVDDVMTTGSTVAELARACRAAGAARVEIWTAARAV